jgi:predicted nucleic acid-binding Zn ribbon protein
MKKREPVHIGSIIPKTLQRFRREGEEQLIKIWKIWDDVVGENNAKHAQPEAFKGRILLVEVSDSSWMHQFHFFLKKDMIAKLNHALGKNLIEDIKFRVGEEMKFKIGDVAEKENMPDE